MWKAAEAEHPFKEGYRLRPRTPKAIHRLLTRGPTYAKQRREKLLERWTRRRDELEEQETALHRELDPQVVAVVAEREIFLFREMVEWAWFVDPRKPTGCWLRGSRSWATSRTRASSRRC